MEVQAAKQNRIAYFDFLRILATFGVILIHISTPYWYHTNVASLDWQVFNLFDSLSRWSVPVFFMISGALFVGSSRDLKTILKKNVLRMVTALVFWSAVYAAVSYLRGEVSPKDAVLAFLFGHYHLWFVYAIIGLYLTVPVLRKIAESKETAAYFLLLSFLFGSALPQAAHCIGLLSGTAEYILIQILNQLQISSLANYAFCFLLGHALQTAALSPKQRKGIYLLGILGAVGTVLLTSAASVWKQEPVSVFYEYNSVNVLFMSAAIFLFAKEHFRYEILSRKAVSLLQKLSRYSFGAYLSHLLVLDGLSLGLDVLSFPPAVSVPATALLVLALSFLVSAVFHKIPVLRKYVV